eukprot:263727-Pelagomonas_calceolata.AAC.1
MSLLTFTSSTADLTLMSRILSMACPGVSKIGAAAGDTAAFDTRQSILPKVCSKRQEKGDTMRCRSRLPGTWQRPKPGNQSCQKLGAKGREYKHCKDTAAFYTRQPTCRKSAAHGRKVGTPCYLGVAAGGMAVFDTGLFFAYK